MLDSETKLSRLVNCLTQELENKEIGHCMRVDHLIREEARDACQKLRHKQILGIEAYVLAGEVEDETQITTDRAIELRNRKRCKLCLFIPADLLDPAISSLGNAFAPFDVEGFLKRLAQELRQQITPKLQPFVRSVRELLTGGAAVAVENEISYYESLLRGPTLERAGEELWRVGLIPYLNPGENFHIRLQLNQQCVDKLARPLRPQASIGERVESLGLKQNTIQTDLLDFLSGRALQSDTNWLKEILTPPHRDRLTFDNWVFPTVERSDIEWIEIEPFVDDEGKVTTYCRLKQPDGTGTELRAECGPKKYIRVKWVTEPKDPSNVARWRVRLVADREHYEAELVAGVELPEVTVSSRSRSAKIPMDIDFESIEVAKVQVRVTSLDSNGVEICSAESGEPIEALSMGFWIEEAEGDIDDGPAPRKATVRSIPDACLDAAMKLGRGEETLVVKSYPIEMETLIYYPFLFNGRYLYRVAVSPLLKVLQEQCLARPETGGRFTIYTSGVDLLTENDFDFQRIQVGEPFAREWEDFLRARERCFKAIRSLSQQTLGEETHNLNQGLVEVSFIEETDENRELRNAIMRYAEIYLNLLTMACAKCNEAEDGVEPYLESIASILQVDTVHLNVSRGGKPTECTLILPTHPLRLLWYLAYWDLTDDWVKQLLSNKRSQRQKVLNMDTVEMLSPVNLPAFVPIAKGKTHAFVANISFFYGLAFPPDVEDPDGLIGDIARLVGFDPQDYSTITISPEAVVGEIEDYLQLHDYLNCLRVNVVNPGSGSFVRKVSSRLIAGEDTEEGGGSKRSLRLDIITHSNESPQYPAPGLDGLFRSVNEMITKRERLYLAPRLQLARRQVSREGLSNIPGGDVHLSLCIDQFLPEICLLEPDSVEESAAVYGLLTQFLSRFESTIAESTWTRMVSFLQETRRETHPIRPLYTTRLTELHQAYLHLTATVHGWGNYTDKVPAICLRLGPERRRILSQLHNQSDWVLTLDRNLGIEYFDSPKDTYLAAEADHYLIDHIPEFIEGVGHRLIVTTAWQEEVADIIRQALNELNLQSHPDCVVNLLNILKAISGRLALRLIGDEKRAKEAIALAVVTEYMRVRGELENMILIPLDAHIDLFQPRSGKIVAGVKTPAYGERCDLIAVDISRRTFRCRFIEVKYRQNEMEMPTQELLDRIVDQIEHTEETFRQHFFPSTTRLDRSLYRCQFASLLRFYLNRAKRHGWITSEEAYEELLQNIGRLEGSYPEIQAKGVGYIVSPNAEPQSSIHYRDKEIYVISRADIDRYTQFAPLSLEKTEQRPEKIQIDTATVFPPDEERFITETTNATVSECREEPDSSMESDTRPTDEVEVPSTTQVVLGERKDTGDNLIWKGSLKGSPHIFILGSTGAGKSTTVRRLLCELARQKLPSLIIDFHGDFVKADDSFVKKFNPMIIDAAEGLPFSPLEVIAADETKSQNLLTNSFEVAEIIGYVCELGEIQRDLVYEAIRDVYQITEIESFNKGEVKPPALNDVFERLKHLEQEHRSGVKNTVARCRPLFEFGLFREPNAPIRFQELIHHPTVIALNHLSMEVLQLAAGAFILRRLYKEMFLWGESDKLRLMVILDEAHRLAKDISLPKLMKEGRKFGIGVVVASQGVRDFHAAVFENAGTKLLFRTNYPDSKKAAQLLRARENLGELSKRLENLQVGHALVQTPEMTKCSLARMFA